MVMNRRMKLLLGGLAGGMMLASLVPGTAEAKKPLDVNCAVLNAAVPLVAAGSPIDFKSLGDLQSTVKKNDAVYAALAGGFAAVTNLLDPGNPVVFATPSEAISTIAKCGGMAALVAEVND